MTSFKEYVRNKENYNKLLDKLVDDKYYESYRKITHQEFTESLDTHKFDLATKVEIPKDEKSNRIIYIYNSLDNFYLKLYNEFLYETRLFLINKNVYSYRTDKNLSHAIKRVHKNYRPEKLYLKLDLKDYFYSPTREDIHDLLVKTELDKEMFSPIFSNRARTKTGEIIEENLGLLAGAPISAFLSNAFLKEFDDYASRKFNLYLRYSDDMLFELDNMNQLAEIEEELKKFNVRVNPKKIHFFQGQPIEFLGCLIDKEITISKNKFVAMKKDIKSLAQKSRKETELSPQERVKHFLWRLNSKYLFPILTDRNKSGTLGFWFLNATVHRHIQEIDFYILDQCKWLMTGKHNQSALKRGYNTLYFEEQGFLSLAKLFCIRRRDYLLFLSEIYEHKIKMKDKLIYTEYFQDSKMQRQERIFILDWIEKYDIKDIYFDFRNRQIIHKEKILFDQTKNEAVINGIGIYLFGESENSEVIKREEFLSMLRGVYTESIDNRYDTRNEIFIISPKYKLGYYSFSNVGRRSYICMVNYLLFSMACRRLKIEFDETSTHYYLQDKFIDFIIPKQVLI